MPQETLVQVRLPSQMARAAKLRAAQMGVPLSHWVRSLIRQELTGPQLEAWSFSRDEKPEHRELRIADIQSGTVKPTFVLGVRHFDGARIVAVVFGALGGGLPHAGPLGPQGLREYETFREPEGHLLFTRPSSWWRIAGVTQLDREGPAWLTLELAGESFDRASASR